MLIYVIVHIVVETTKCLGGFIMNCSHNGLLSKDRGIITIGINPAYIKNNIYKSFSEEANIFCFDNASAHVKIDFFHIYEIYIDENFQQGLNSIIHVLNTLIPLDCNIRVKVLKEASVSKPINEGLNQLLKRLQKHNFIKFENCEVKNISVSCTPAKPTNNICFFVGPCDTGKSSIAAATVRKFTEHNKRVAMIDLSKHHKLNNHFTSYTSINSDSLKQFDYSSIPNANLFSLYNYSFSMDYKPSNIIILCDFITRLSNLFDYVIITSDEKAVAKITNVFKLASKIFFVLDQDKTKIPKIKCMVLKLMLNGIKTKKVISLIHNNTDKVKSDMRYIEENALFVSFPKRKLISTIDIHCTTIEVPFTKGLCDISKIRNKHSYLKYLRSIEKIYLYLNDIPYIEEEEKDLYLYAKEKIESIDLKSVFKKSMLNLSIFFRNKFNLRSR